MKVSYYVDTRRQMSDGSFKIFINVTTDDKKRFMVATPLKTFSDLADGEFPCTEVRYKTKTESLKRYLMLSKQFLDCNYDKPVQDLKDGIAEILSGKVVVRKQRPFSYYIDEYINNKVTHAPTKKLYTQTKNVVLDFDPNATFDNITPEWLKALEDHRRKLGRKTNGIGRTMRDIRTVFNYARKKNYTSNYPFVDYTPPTEQTQHRNLSVETFRNIMSYPCEEFQVRYRDAFVLSTFLWGINIGDMLLLKKDSYKDGYIHYDRQKTGKSIKIKVEPEAEAIINRYAGKEHLLEWMDGRADYHSFLRQTNDALQTIGMKFAPGKKPEGKPLYPYLTTYYARHSISTFAAEIGSSMSTISMGLSHTMSGGANVTKVYVGFQQWMIDDCMRDVIDYINSGLSAREFRRKKALDDAGISQLLKELNLRIG